MRWLGIGIAVMLVVIVVVVVVVVVVTLGGGGVDDGDEGKVDVVDDIAAEPSTCFTTGDELRTAMDV
jgi:hypothetical protein